MSKIKRILSMVLALAVMLSLALPVSAKSFTDLDGHWAKSYMEDLNKRGYLSGYTDGTMKPEGAITGCEALVFLSRFYGLSDEELEYVTDDYGDIVDDALPASLSWAADEVAVCLAAGIVKESELKTANLQQKIEKQQLAVYLVRALGLESRAEANSGESLTFTDKADINTTCLGYIATLVDIGIIQGDTTNQFTPKVSVTRAMAATMVSRGLDYMEDEDIEPEVDGYTGLERLTGILTKVGSKTVQLRGFDGMLREYSLAKGYTVKVNGSKKSLSDDYEGCYAELGSLNGAITDLRITEDEDVAYLVGRISSVSEGKTENTLSIYDFAKEKSTKIKLTKDYDLNISIAGKDADFDELKKNQFVIALFEDAKLENMFVESGDYDMSGTVSSISYGTTVEFKLADKNGTIYVFPMAITDLPKVERGKTTITIDRLVEGDKVTVEVEDCQVDTIVSEASESAVTGTLSSITTTSDGTWWTITDEDGDDAKYQVDTAAGVYKGSKSISLSDIKIGDAVSVVVYGKVIAEIELKSAAVSSDKITVTVLAVEKKVITALLGNKLVYIDSSDAAIFNTATGKSMKLSELDAETIITVYGSYKSSANFEATSIVVE